MVRHRKYTSHDKVTVAESNEMQMLPAFACGLSTQRTLMAGHKTSQTLLGDFRTDRRMLLLVVLALPVGVISALVAKALLWLIAEITNLVFFQRFSPVLGSLEHHHLGAWVILAPVVGALIIGLMARYGSEKIRGHGIPEALEAILLGAQFDSAESGDAQTDFIRHLHRHGRTVRGGRSDHHDGRRVWFHPRAVVSPHCRGTQNAPRGRRGRRHVRGFCLAHCGDVARGRIAPFRMEAAQFHSGDGGLGRRLVAARSAAWRRTDISRRATRAVRLRARSVSPASSGLSSASARVCSRCWSIFAKTSFSNSPSTGCGGRPSARCLSARWLDRSARARRRL